MVDTIYVEREISEHERSRRILNKFPRAKIIEVDHYGQVFNSNSQNFRLQKQNPSLILASKNNKRVMPTPSQYETGGGEHFYFSHMLNCIYDCRYCFLQGMFRSANYLVFVNYEDFLEDIKTLAQQHRDNHKPSWFFSGYDCDSLAYEPITQFASTFVPSFDSIPNSVLELRTKSTQIRQLLSIEARENIVVAYSLSPDAVVNSLESGTPSFDKRLKALMQLQEKGWRLGIRFDPIIWHDNYLIG